MCTGRIDLAFLLRAFSNGNDGVFIGGCWPGECHYITEGNYLTLSRTLLFRKLMELMGLNPERLRLEWVSASEGSRFAEVMNDFSDKLKVLGPLGKETGVDKDGLKFKFEAFKHMIPYIKLVERERLRIRTKSEQAYLDFFASSEFDRLFKELIVDKLESSQIMALLRKNALSTGEISETLGLSPSEVARHIKNSSRQGLIRYDNNGKYFAAA